MNSSANKEYEPIWLIERKFNPTLLRYEEVSRKVIDYDYDGMEFNDGYYYD